MRWISPYRLACSAIIGLICETISCSPTGHPDAGGSATTTTQPSAATTVPAAGAGPKPAKFYCFAWTHGEAHSKDCYRNADDCEHERTAMTGSYVAESCGGSSRATCVHVHRPPSTQDFERCFGDTGACERYRAFVQQSGHIANACTEQ